MAMNLHEQNATEQIWAYLPPALADEIRRRARRDHRSVSSWMRVHLARTIDVETDGAEMANA
jgi:hypothetical protein